MIGFLESCLKHKKFRELMMHQYGSIVLGASKNLLDQAKDLINQLGRLETDMDEVPEKTEPDWADYKRQQRANHLREYWEKLRKRRDRMRELRKLYSRSGAISHQVGDPGFIAGFVEPFSSEGNTRREWQGQLADLQKAGLSRLLPWRSILAHELASGKTRISDINPVIDDRKKDTAFKFQFLLELANDHKITLHQSKPFHEVEIEATPNCKRLDASLTLKDGSGRTYPLDWDELTSCQRQKIIEDLKDGKVMLV